MFLIPTVKHFCGKQHSPLERTDNFGPALLNNDDLDNLSILFEKSALINIRISLQNKKANNYK